MKRCNMRISVWFGIFIMGALLASVKCFGAHSNIYFQNYTKYIVKVVCTATLFPNGSAAGPPKTTVHAPEESKHQQMGYSIYRKMSHKDTPQPNTINFVNLDVYYRKNLAGSTWNEVQANITGRLPVSGDGLYAQVDDMSSTTTDWAYFGVGPGIPPLFNLGYALKPSIPNDIRFALCHSAGANVIRL